MILYKKGLSKDLHNSKQYPLELIMLVQNNLIYTVHKLSMLAKVKYSEWGCDEEVHAYL